MFAPATIRLSSSVPREVLRSIAMERLLRLTLTKIGESPFGPAPCERAKSPAWGGSTLITSAPWSARIIVAIGPATACVKSIIRTPLSGPSIQGFASCIEHNHDACCAAPYVAKVTRRPSQQVGRSGGRKSDPELA